MKKPSNQVPSPQPKQSAQPKASDKPATETKVEAQQPAAPATESVRAMPRRESGSSSERMSLKIVGDKFDRESLRPASEERLKQVLVTTFRDEKMRQWMGIAGSAEAAAVMEIVPPSLVGNILDMAARVEASILSKRTGLSYAKCLEFLEWDEREHARLDKDGAMIISKYIPAEWLVRADLWIFLSSLISLTSIKIAALSDYAKKVDKTKVDVTLEQVERATRKDEERNAAAATIRKEPETFDIPLDFTTPPPEEQSPKQSYESPS